MLSISQFPPPEQVKIFQVFFAVAAASAGSFLDDDSYVKKLGREQLISLNGQYVPIAIREWDTFHIFGKVVG